MKTSKVLKIEKLITLEKIVRFSEDINFKEESETLGLSNDLDAIKELINKERTDSEGGTNYTVAFEEANKLFENVNGENRDSVAIFVSDGAPSIYNKLKYTIYKNTSDNEVGHHADNWVNYLLNTDLKENELMKESGVKIYTVGSENSNNAITSIGSFVVTSEDTVPLLQKLATENSYFYDWQSIDTDLDKIYDSIIENFKIYPQNASVIDTLSDDFILVNQNIENENIKIEIKHGDTVIEEITFSDDGTKAYSSLEPEENILTTDDEGNITLKTNNFSYSSKEKLITWNIEKLDEQGWSITYPVYLINSANLFEDGTKRESGTYSTNKEARLTYVNHLQETINIEFPSPNITWEEIETPPEENIPNKPNDDNTTATKPIPQTGQSLIIIFIIALASISALIYGIKLRQNRDI